MDVFEIGFIKDEGEYLFIILIVYLKFAKLK